MATKAHAYIPSMSDATVKAKTGKAWAGWFEALDKAGAARLEHRAIADLLSAQHGLPGWWCQMVTVEYERARGLRLRHETASGFSVTISKTVATSPSHLYEATANPAQRRAWFPRGVFELSSQTRNKYFRGSWNRTARLEVGFSPRGQGKAQIAVGVYRLTKRADVEAQRSAWRKALDKLAALVQA
ncbi:MAG: hypothetical protein L0027_06245 [Candidatus Rokubacteria bacterium]|nr:hypothetical protein [Candidatus Rokubacteria bacterium]